MRTLGNDRFAAEVHGRAARLLPLQHLGMGRPLRHLARAARAARRRRAGRARRARGGRAPGRRRGARGARLRRRPSLPNGATGCGRAAPPRRSPRALDDDLAALMRDARSPAARRRLRHGRDDPGRAGAGPLRRLVRALPPLARRGRTARHARRRRGGRSPGSPRWASTSSTCRRSIRSGETQAQGPEQRAGAPGRATPGSPWAIGAAEGGHTAVHPELGTVAGVRRLAATCARARHGARARPRLPVLARPSVGVGAPGVVPAAARRLDPVRREPAEAVRGHLSARLRVRRLGGALAGAPRRGRATGSTQGVTVFRVDNPHTKPFAFWEWLIAEVKRAHPEVDPPGRGVHPARVMERLAKLGFSQSYTYFAWRHTKHELEEYLRELTQTGVAEYFRPNFWPNTPDILTEAMQSGGRPTFAARLVLAATLSAELRRLRTGVRAGRAARPAPGQRGVPRLREVPASPWDIDDAGSLAPLLRRRERRPPRPPGPPEQRAAVVPRHRKRRARRLHASTRPTSPTSCSPSSTSTRTTSSPAGSSCPCDRARHRPRSPLPGARPARR